MRLPPALAARATPEILALLGEPPGRVLELGFAGIHAVPLRLAGFDVVGDAPEPSARARARARAGAALGAAPDGPFDVVLAPAGTVLSGLDARSAILVGQDGSAWRLALP
jgi:hypothetical protein